MAVLVTKWFGVFRVDAGKVAAEARFPPSARAIADRLARLRRGEILEEERSLAASGAVEVLEPRLKALGSVSDKTPFFDLAVEEPDRRILHEASLLVSRDESRAASGEKDRFLAHAVRSMEELTTALNTLVERIREWYGLHFPEALARLPDPATFVNTLAENPNREAVAKLLAGVSSADSIGVELGATELDALQGFARRLAGLFEERNRLERLVAHQATAVAPNLCQVVGDVLAAKLIARAGSLEALAAAPASTLQTLGAEQALFAHLKEGKKPPKHGVLFQHGLVNTAPWWQRGKMARILSTNASLAARLDFYGGKASPETTKLLARVEAQVARVKTDARLPPQQRRREPRPAVWRGGGKPGPGGRR